MALTDQLIEAAQRLTEVRAPEADRLAKSMQTDQIVGVLGEAEVGKTEVIAQALRRRATDSALVRLDLDGVGGPPQLAFLIAKEIAAAFLGISAFSILSAGVLVTSEIERDRVELSRLLGVDGLDEALRPWPSGTYALDKALAAIERLAADRPTIVWLDHAETPSLTPRHPLDVEELLWGLRAIAQRQNRLKLILSARAAFDRELLSRDRAFYEQGRWLSIDNPSEQVWLEFSDRVHADPEVVEELFRLTGGHPATMLRGATLAAGGRPRTGRDVFVDLASASAPLAARSTQHARSLHRLGSQVLTQIAMGQRPYASAQKGSSPPQEIRRVLGRLHLAGLIRHDPAGWSVVDPLVRAALNREIQPTVAADRI